MKRLMILLLLSINVASLIFASPAVSIMKKVMQPNGDTIFVSLKGDEYGSWYEDAKGDIIALNNDKYWVYVAIENGNMIQTNQIVSQTSTPMSINRDSVFKYIIQKREYNYINKTVSLEEQANSRAITGKNASLPTKGVQKILTVLVQFTDVKFQDQNGINQEITKMMNQVNYRHPGQDSITGSLRDFYLEASYNQLTIDATVIGPFTVSHNRAYYGGNSTSGEDIRPQALAREVMSNIANLIDVSQYDNNNDGWVECIHILYAGQGEDLFGVTSDAIWPHRWSLNTWVNGNGAKMSRYIMTPELGDFSTYRGMGTACHELGHILGAPDFYDTENDVFAGTQFFDLMAKGSWNGEILAISPAHPNPYLKTELFGWTSSVELLGSNRLYIIPPSELYNVIYKIPTSTSGEYYLLENRQSVGLPGKGLVIYHVNASIEDFIPDNEVNIAHRQNLYVVDANNHIAKPTGSVASYGNIDSHYATFRDTFSKNIYFTSTSKPSNCNWNGDTTYNKDVCFISEEMIDGEMCVKFVLNPEIDGPDILCDSAIYSLKHVPSNATVEWTYVRPSAAPLGSTPLYVGSGQGTKNVYFKRGIMLGSDADLEQPTNPWIPVMAAASFISTRPYQGFVTIKANVIFNGDTFSLSKEIYMPEKVMIDNVYTGPTDVWYTHTMKSMTLTKPTDETVLEDIRWDIEYPNGSTQTAHGGSVVVRPTTAGTLKVTATYINGCNDEYESQTKTYSIVSLFNMTFTNPASGSVDVNVTNGDASNESDVQTMSLNNQQTPYMGAYRLELWHDLYGKVREIDASENTPTVTMNLDGLNSGVYVLRLVIDNQIVVAEQMIVK